MKVTRLYGTAYVIYGDTNQPIASAVLTTVEAGKAEIKALWVDPEHRGKGLAKELINMMVGDAEGADEIIIHTAVDNDVMNHLAESCGFKLWHRWYK